MKTVVITGASSGLGAALAKAYAARDVRLGLTGRSGERLALTAEACRAKGAVVEAAEMDVRDAPGLADWLSKLEKVGAIDVLVANAGVSAGPPPAARAEGLETATLQVTTNLLGVMNTIEPVLPGMLARRAGRIAIVSSIASLRGLPYSPGYSASKAGSRAYGDALRALVRPAGVSVTVICPGFFSSPMTDRWKGDTPFLSTAEQVAAKAKRAIDRGRARLYMPWPLVLGLRAAELGPPALTDLILRNFHFHISPP